MDIYQYFDNDIGIAGNGDLQTVDGIEEGKQRILRRLLTNPGAYITHPTYGAGLPLFVGLPLSTSNYQKILGVITSQLQYEQCVARSPAPVITLQQIPEGIFANINYTDAGTLTPQVLTFSVTN